MNIIIRLLLISLMFSSSIWAANIPHDSGPKIPKEKTPRQSPRSTKYNIKHFEQSYEIFMPNGFQQEIRPEVTLELIAKFLRINTCLENTCAPIPIFRVAAPHQDHMFIFYSPNLRDEKQLKNGSNIVFYERKCFPGPLETKIFVYLVSSAQGENEFLFWISHFLKSELDAASQDAKSSLKDMQQTYIKDLLRRFDYYHEQEPRNTETTTAVRFEDHEPLYPDCPDGQETPRHQYSPLSGLPKLNSKLFGESSRSRALFRKRKPSQTSDDSGSSGTTQMTPPSSPTFSREGFIKPPESSWINSDQKNGNLPCLILTGHDLICLYQHGLCLKFTQDGNSTTLSVEAISSAQNDVNDNDLFSDQPVSQHEPLNTNINCRLKKQVYQTAESSGQYSSSKSSPEISEPVRPPIKKRSNSTPPNRQVNQDAPKSPHN